MLHYDHTRRDDTDVLHVPVLRAGRDAATNGAAMTRADSGSGGARFQQRVACVGKLDVTVLDAKCLWEAA